MYLDSIKKEKQAFQQLIQEKAVSTWIILKYEIEPWETWILIVVL